MNVGVLGLLIDDFDFQWALFVAEPLQCFPRLLSHALFHADGAHLLSNILFFAVFGPAVERVAGSRLFAVLLVAWAALAAIVQGFFLPFGRGLIGASGAISGAAGAFFVLFPWRPPRHILGVLTRGGFNRIPTFLWLGVWFGHQLWLGFQVLMPEQLAGRVSPVGYWAHVGGFTAGASLTWGLLMAGVLDNEQNVSQ